MRLKIRLIFLAGTVLLLSPGHPALAHKVNLFCYFEDGVLKGEGYYGGGRPARNAAIEVYSLKGDALMATTQTDEEGRFSAEGGLVGPVRVIMKAGQGHRAEFVVEEEGTATAADNKALGGKVVAESEGTRLLEDRIKRLEARVGHLERRSSEPGPMTVVAGLGGIAVLFALVHLAKKKNAL